MKALRLFVLAGLVSGLAACGTMINGFTQDVTIQTTPPGATVALPDGQSCVSPCTLTIDRTTSPLLTASKPGCQHVQREVPSLFPEGGTAWHSVVDWQTGASAEHRPNPVDIALDCDPGSMVTLDPYDDKTIALIKGEADGMGKLPPFDAEAFLRLRNRALPRTPLTP
ncbi:MAG: hypothetical protein WCJ64_03890 [Rhodospirillaceae bacterium]